MSEYLARDIPMEKVETEARFRDIEELLTRAFALESKTLYPLAGTEFGVHGTNPAEATALELLCEGAMLRSFALRTAGLRGGKIIRARYRRPTTHQLHLAHDQDCLNVQFFLIHELKTKRGKIPPRYMMVDWVREWSFAGRPSRTTDDWCKRREIARSTAYRWRTQAFESMTKWLNLAQWRIEPEAKERGLIPE